MLRLCSLCPIVALSFLAACGSPMILSSSVLAQGGGQVMILNDGESGPTVTHLSMPNLAGLRQPDFTKRDLPLFNEKLVLSDAQLVAIERQIEAYLEAFEKLRMEFIPKSAREPVVIRGFGGDGEEGEGGAVALVFGDPDELPRIDMDELPDGMPTRMGVNVAVRAGGAEGGGDGDDGAPSGVTVSLSTPDDEELTDEQRKRMEQIAEEMTETIRKQMEEREAAGEAGAPPLLPSAMKLEELVQQQEELAAKVKLFTKAKSDLRQGFVNEAHTKLSTTQIERWSALERALLRDRSLPKGRLSGERTDLFKVLKGIQLDSHHQDAIAPELDAYEMALDIALRQRDEYVQDARPKIDRALQENHFDRALSLVDRAAALRVAVRSINEQWADAIAALLPAEAAEAFRSAVLSASYPQIYRPTYGERTFAAARKLVGEGIDAATMQSLSELEQAFQIELADANLQIRRIVNKHEPIEPRFPIEHMRDVMAGESTERMLGPAQDSPIREAFAKRRAMEERYASAVAGMLSPEQVALLPKRPVQRQRGEPLIIRRSSTDVQTPN